MKSSKREEYIRKRRSKKRQKNRSRYINNRRCKEERGKRIW
jgi:hypothetical protein